MIPVLYPATERTFSNNGLGGLPNAINCVVTEKRNIIGGYYLEMDYPIDGLHYGDIIQERIIYASPAPKKVPQPFRIQSVSKPIDGIVHIEAPHVSAELQKIVTYGAFFSHSAAVSFNELASVATQTGQSVPFHFYTDMWSEDARPISFPEPRAFSDIIVGTQGSLIDTFGGELDFDKWNIGHHASRGSDRGLEIRYGVNMTQLDAETDASELVTAVMPYWVGDVNGTETVIVGDLCASDNVKAFSYMRTVPLDVSSQFGGSEPPKKAQVTSAGRTFINKTELKEVSMSTMVKYIPTTVEIGDRSIYLCDTVRVVHPDLKVSSTAKVVEVKYNVLTERYDEITIGSIKQSIVDTIAKMIKKG